MKNEIRTVIDTNVVVSAILLPRSMSRQAFDAAVLRGRLLVSNATIAELYDVIRRPKFNKYILERLRLEFIAALVQKAEIVKITEVINACRDPKDNKFLDLAISGYAQYIISGDTDLLVLHPFRGVDIVSPRFFINS